MRPQGYPANRRLRKHADYDLVYSQGKKLHGRHFLLFALKPGRGPQLTGIAVSRRIGNAVTRNRIKRVLREFFRMLPFSIPGCHLVVVARYGADSLRLGDVQAELMPLVLRVAEW